jgi:GLPGLI family protein
MNKKTIISIIFFFKLIFIYAQINNGTITYILYNNFSEDKLNNPRAGSFYRNAISDNGKIEYLLIFNDKKSLFKRKENDLKQIDIFSNYNTNIILDKEKNCLYFNQSITEIYIKEKYKITKCDTIGWEITSENKLIDNKNCFKAKKKDYYDFKNKKYYDIIAWFCPEIPLKLGPLYYYGLPGLIVELTIDNETTYIISKIEEGKNIEINDPIGIDIDYENYQKMSREVLEEGLNYVKSLKNKN